MSAARWQEERFALIAKVRRNAKKDARSGNPAKRIPALRALRQADELYRRTARGVR